MTAPTRHERRPDAEVVVYGDDAPITDAEWHCARLVGALYALPLVIDADALYRRDNVYAGNVDADVAETRPTRAEAVAALAEQLVSYARGNADVFAMWAHQARVEARQATERAERYEADAARLRALLGGSDGR